MAVRIEKVCVPIPGHPGPPPYVTTVVPIPKEPKGTGKSPSR